MTNNEQTLKPGVNTHHKRKLLYILLLLAGVIIMIFLGILLKKPSDPEEYITNAGYGGVFLMGVIGSASPLWPLPGSWAAFIAVGLAGLNPIFIGFIAGLGEAIGELSGYTAGYGGQIAVQRWKRYMQIKNWMQRYGGPTIFAVSAIPNFFIKLATIAAGSLRYPLWKFFIFCWIGKIIKSLCFAYAGYYFFDQLKDIIERYF